MLKLGLSDISKNQRVSVFAIAAVVLTISIGSFTGIQLILESHKSALLEDLEVRSNFLAKSVSDRALLNLMLSDTSALEQINTEVEKASYGISSVSFYDAQDALLYGPQGAPSKNTITASYPIADNTGVVIGAMKFSNRTSEISSRLQALEFKFILIDLLLILLTLVVSIWSIRSVIKYHRDQCEAQTKMMLAEKNNELQQKFMAIMSHELRTPLNAISGFCGLLRSTHDEEASHNYLNIINESANSMMVLVNDILDYSKITQDELQFNEVNFCFNDLVNQTVKMCEHKRNEGVQLMFVPSHELLPVMGDANRIRQVIINLVSNALKFTFEGSVAINYKVELNQESYRFYFEVKDSGIGIPDAKKDSLFVPYAQAHLDREIKVESTGLGLSICKRLVEKMGGTIGFTSTKGIGSNFFFELSLPVGEKKDCNTYLEEQKLKDLNLRGKVLIVDDVQLNRLLLVKILKRWGISTVEASNGAEAVEMVANESFDVILMDLEMPVMNGVEAAMVIKDKHPGTTIIACSANNVDLNSPENNFDAAIEKPIKPNRIAHLMDYYLFVDSQKSLA